MKIKAVVFIFLISILSGCVAVVMAGAAGMVVYDKRTVFKIESDARIFYQVNKAIVSDSRFRGAHIVVSSFNEVVLLSGQVNDVSLKFLAEQIAKNTPKVQRVYNEIEVEPVTSFSQRSKDSWITSQVRAQMLAKKGLESGSIRVVTEKGVVYMMGVVSKEQSQLAVDVARKVNGVEKVVKIFRYIHIT